MEHQISGVFGVESPARGAEPNVMETGQNALNAMGIWR